MAEAGKYTMRDVARLAGVSVSTVSAVINGTVRVSPKRAERVSKAMEALDYHPDSVARSLKTGRTDVVGVVVPDIANAFYPEVIRGIEMTAQAAGYSVILCDSNEDPQQERKLLSALFSKRVDGVLIACSDQAMAYDSLIRRRFPIIFFDRVPKDFPGAVSVDNVSAAADVVRHLASLRHRRIGLIAGSSNLAPHLERIEGFRMAMGGAGLPVREELLREGERNPAGGYRCGAELLGLPRRPTAIICTNNRMLLGLMRAVHDSGLRCPDDLSVVGFDDYPWTEHFLPPMTMVAQPAREMGKRAMELLLARLRGEVAIVEAAVRLRAELRVRESTAPPGSVGRRLASGRKVS